jgi:uncharacterized protein YhaN
VSTTTLEFAILVQSRFFDELQDEKKHKEKLSAQLEELKIQLADEKKQKEKLFAQLEELKIQLAEAKMSNEKHSGNF